MAFHAPAASLPSIVSVAGELWPSASAALQAPWRIRTRPASATTPSRNVRADGQRSFSDAVASSAPAETISQTRGETGIALTRTSLPDFFASVPASELTPKHNAISTWSPPTALGLLHSVPSHCLNRPNPFKSPLLLRPFSRSFSSSRRIMGPFTFQSGLNNSIGGVAQRRSFWGSSAGQSTPNYSHLSNMEATANNNPRSATAQSAFYSALLRANRPDLVVQRYESRNFASNQATDLTYQQALNQMSQLSAATQNTGAFQGAAVGQQKLSDEQLQAVAQAVGSRVQGGATSTARSGTGAKGSPLYVVMEESLGSAFFRWVKFVLWFGFSLWAFYVILTMVIEGTGVLRKVGGSRQFETKPEVQKTRFADVHGCEEAKEELQEIVEFLKSPEKYSTLGGKLPKGVLLVGPPGTGKTLLARAVAGEAGVPFFYMSGSEFDEVYVGVGAKRIRELFAAARAKAPAIVFIDELDAIGGKRNERDAAYAKQTLNQLLTDLDGFNQDSGVIFLAATNFPELLDKALTRPGRFDRQVVVPLPDVRGRSQILQHYMKKMSLGQDVDATIIARGTPGFSGAELENLINTAAVYASKRKATRVSMLDFEWAKDRILMGAERKSAVIQQKDKVMTAYHEGGHALVALFTPHADPLYKATIMPRGHALGITFQLPELDKVSMAKQEYQAKIDVCMGGKVAEEMVYGLEATTGGASSDIQTATAVAYAMVTQLGMSDKLGNVDLHSDYGRLPAETKQLIWQEVRRLVEEGKARAHTLLTAKRMELDRLADALVEYETLGKDQMEKVIRGEKLPDALKGVTGPPIGIPEIPLPLPVGVPPSPGGGGIGVGVPQGPGDDAVDEPTGVPGVPTGSGNGPQRPYPVSRESSS